MNTLEEGFREILREIKNVSQTQGSTSRRDSDRDSGTMQMPVRRVASYERGGKRSPKKKKSKGKEMDQGQSSVGAMDIANSPVSVQSVIEMPPESAEQARPSTALWTPSRRTDQA